MLTVHRAARADDLVAGLADLLAAPTPGGIDPFAPEVVAVPTRGIERWIAQQLSTRLGAGPGRTDGVCANVEFPFPGRVVGQAVALAAGIHAQDDPWQPQRLVWPLLEVLEERLGGPADGGGAAAALTPLLAHLGGPDDPRRARRFAAARHIAELFDRYAVHRPAMLERWDRGDDVDGSGAALEDDARWQPALWRAVAERLGLPGPAQRLGAAVRRLHAGAVEGLAGRVSLFGLTALPASYVEVLAALGRHHDVHLFLLHPSPALWERVGAALAGGAPGRRGGLPRTSDPTRGLPRNPLLGSWGRDAREMQVVLAAAGDVRDAPTGLAAAEGRGTGDRQGRGPSAPRTLLRALQAAVRADEAPPGPPLTPGQEDHRPLLAAGDRSVQVHACHGRTRQVEVLRDAVLHLLAEDETLEPRDVIVLCPDIEAFAPLVSAVFGAHAVAPDDGAGGSAGQAGHPGGAGGVPDLRVSLADRALRQTNPLLRVAAELLELADGRATASEVLALASRDPVRRRFRFDDEALERLDAWVGEARVRWGLDAGHRAAFALDGVAANTWRAGLDRILLGVAMADEGDRMVHGTVPLDDVEGPDVELAGRLAELVDRLGRALAALQGPQPIAAWRDALADALAALTAVRERDRWQDQQLHRLLDDVVDEARLDDRLTATPLTLPEVRSLLEDRLRGRPTRASHRTGDLTVCTLVPMRSVPHRVVCLLGLDDGTFPRRLTGDGDDLMDRDPHVGDRDPRTEDRQLLLDALLAAGDHLVVTYAGRDERTNEPRPPAVPVGELLDTIDRTVRAPDGGRARRCVVVEHPLQPTDSRNFRPGALAGDDPWAFDPVALAGALASRDEQLDPDFLAAPLGPLPDQPVVALEDLVRFYEHPVKAFLRRRLGVVLPSVADRPTDAIPVELGGLEEWDVGQRLLDVELAGGDVAAFRASERARGVLPPGGLGDAAMAGLQANIDALVAQARALVDLDAPRRLLDVAVPLPPQAEGPRGVEGPPQGASFPGDGSPRAGASGRRLSGTVGAVGDAVVAIGYRRMKPKIRLAAWVRLLAAVAAHPDEVRRAVVVARSESSSARQLATASCLTVPDLPPAERRAWALERLGCLVELYDRGLREPLPLYCTTSSAWARAVRDGKDPHGPARAAWATEWRYPKEDRDPEHVLVLGPDAAFDELLRDAPTADECGPGWAMEEDTRFGRCARRVWDDLLDREETP